MNKLLWIKITAVCGALAVALGAFAAHGLKPQLSEVQLQTYQTAVQYHFIHTLALLAIINLPLCERRLLWVARSFLLGIVLFSGSLYTIALTSISAIGLLTPFGGSAFIVGWLLLITAKSPKNNGN
ncbi:MAG: DUF423 domain-containing protein [Porticoccaceae bacterium]|nr:DUF423 domain-containing protein [Porticoccaceae bacterium]